MAEISVKVILDRNWANGGIGLGVGYAGDDFSIYADAELIDWSQLRLDATDFSFAAENRLIREQLEGVLNFRVGGEYDFGRVVARAGLAVSPDQREASAGRQGLANPERDRAYVSLGLTYKASRNFLFDVGVSGEGFQDSFEPYAVTNGPVVDEEVSRGRLSIGIRARL
jgi:long-subunit fatty acid transport protein